jgi:recombination protein RecT
MKEKEQESQGGLFNKEGQSTTTQEATKKEETPESKTPNSSAEPKKENVPKEAASEAKKTPSQPPAKKRSDSAVNQLAAINAMSIPALVKTQPKEKFIAAMVGSSPSKDDYNKAEKEFMKEANFAIQAFGNNDYLTKVGKDDKLSVINAIINVAQTGLTLNPVLKLGYLVPMDRKVLFWPSYMGKREIVMRTGTVKDAYAKLVYKTDKFDVKYGTGAYLKHEPDPWSEKKLGDVVGGYWFCILKDGTEKFGTMNQAEIVAIQKRSPSVNASHSPWKTDWEQMALKTIFNRGFKEMPKSGISEEQLRALEISDRPEEETLKSWIKSIETKQDKFDDDSDEDDGIQDVEVV